jgi:hypothetical protein
MSDSIKEFLTVAGLIILGLILLVPALIVFIAVLVFMVVIVGMCLGVLAVIAAIDSISMA